MEALEALGPMTSETDAANPSQEQQQQEQAKATETADAEEGAKDWGMIPFSIGGLLTMIEPALKPVYSEERCFAWGLQAHKVAKKYGLDGPNKLPELALITSTIGFALPSYFAIAARVKQMKEGNAEGLLAKVGVWWRTRKAAKAAAKAAQDSRTVDAG